MYKFYSIRDIDIISKLVGSTPTIKFSSAFNLNDPYELKFNLTIDPTNEKEKEAYFKIYPQKSIEDFENWQKQITPNFIWHTEQLHRNAIAQSITLSSFSLVKNNNLMWSHYADQHRGICIEYSNELISYFEKHPKFMSHSKVNYSDLPPSIDSSEDINQKIPKMMFNKQSEWHYEQEYRVILESKEDSDFININPSHIKHVFIGSRTISEHMKLIISLCKSNQIPISYAITLGKGYKVIFKAYQENSFPMRSFWK